MPRKVRKPPKYMRNAAQNIFVTDTLVPIDTDAEGAQPAQRRSSRALALPRKNLTPEEYLREVMQDEGKRDELRMAAAGALLRYAKEPDDGPKLNEEQLDERIAYLLEQLGRLGVKGGVSQEAGRTIDVEAIEEDSGHIPGQWPVEAGALPEAHGVSGGGKDAPGAGHDGWQPDGQVINGGLRGDVPRDGGLSGMVDGQAVPISSDMLGGG